MADDTKAANTDGDGQCLECECWCDAEHLNTDEEGNGPVCDNCIRISTGEEPRK